MSLIERMIADGLSKGFDMCKSVFSPRIIWMDTDGLACARVFLVHGLHRWTRMDGLHKIWDVLILPFSIKKDGFDMGFGCFIQ